MSLSLRIFIIYMLFVALCSYFVLRTVMEEIRPGVRQTTEETLVDTANLLAEFLREPMLNKQINNDFYADIFRAYGQRTPNANIWGVNKFAVNHRIYVTDSKGIVLLDSKNIAVGQDYSRWNDVYLTLQGKYGARSSHEVEGDERTSIMYVAAPIKHGDDIIGVVSVAKPNRSVQPFIDRTQQRLGLLAGGLILLGLLSGAVFSWWLSRELRKLREYAVNVSQGARASIPQGRIASGELRQLAQALESMRTELDGKAYIERYVQTLAHELKSPLAGIRAAAELLQTPLLQAPENQQQRQRFISNIDSESLRLQHLIERLLNLALVEQQQSLHDPQLVDLNALCDELISNHMARIAQQSLQIHKDYAPSSWVTGEMFLLRQAINNLLENALDFTPQGGIIRLQTLRQGDSLQLSICNQGEPIPEFAFARLTERFFSLPRPQTGKKSTGLGLNFVQEVMTLHKGELSIVNLASISPAVQQAGVQVVLSFTAP
ncbi:two-component system sensor histidine kinase CreC [Cellvibrio sp. PSBB023]|uniref:two-component system sensor histidine kinase CreC n=1 Tax=Cellvibrio sp. PSBB023 TaxID=1945512 RepID=UPI00099015DF|nr:two-component system sensor histidine kinase CreC [Cellvibrio sp. PSBB023]AQT59985.1 two-component system sensor histidine kinase CreC [Cellvibrio sp. PSBB023]